MENVFENFLSIQVLFFCLFVWGLSLVIRRAVEYFFSSINSKKYWKELILPIMPMIIGAALSLVAKKYPYPHPFDTSTSARLFFGFVAGSISGYVYRIIKAFLLNKKKEILNSGKQS